eukprot:m.29020 g.29020  ORF g.29020 m.29020 type:complete len:613 (-) comp9127_c0_seq1:24-1862(-)
MASDGVCLVVGGAGFLGIKLAGMLVDGGARVRILDLAVPQSISSLVEVVLGDLRDRATLDRALKGVHTVFHVASVVDLSPFLSSHMANINIEGTRALLAACRDHNVSFFVYTSSIDVVFTGRPVANGDETLPQISSPDLCPYGWTKSEAEKLVLAANSDTLHTVAIRPGHIYGPGDFMISHILGLVAEGKVPFRFGGGDNDYIYVDNCAVAHLQCWRALIATPDNVAGQAYSISDYHCNIWRHMTVFLQVRQLNVPSAWVPLWVAYGLAWLTHIFIVAYRAVTGKVLPLVFSRYAVLATGQDFYCCSERAAKTFKFRSVVPLQAARMRTAEWVLTLPLPTPTPFRLVHLLHLIYGLLLAGAGLYQFLFPVAINRLLHMSTAPFPSSVAVLSQTFGLIIGVLGLYSIVAALGRWSHTFFLVTCWSKIITGAVFLFHVANEHVPFQMQYAGLLEVAVGLLTLGLSLGTRANLRIRMDRVTVAQMLHATASGLFTAALMARPAVVLPLVVPGEAGIASNPTALAWGYSMGTAEWMMTWTYTASAFFVALQPFVGLSIVTRLLAVTSLAISFLLGTSSSTQLAGVLPDGILALISLWALVTCPAPATRAERNRKGT